MRLPPHIAATALGATLVAAAPAQASGVFTIDFEDQTPLTFVSNPLIYPYATFTSGGAGLFIADTNTNGLCPSTGIDCSASLTVDFVPAPIYFAADVSFTVTGDHAAGLTGQVEVWRAGVLVGVADILTDGIFASLDLVDLTSFGEINRLVITSTDLGGFSYDNFNFNIIVVDFPVPAPATLALFGLGLAGLGLARRR
jgi:hypothetical protein